MRMWIARDNDHEQETYLYFGNKPAKDHGGAYENDPDHWSALADHDIAMVLGRDLHPGECVELEVTEVREDKPDTKTIGSCGSCRFWSIGATRGEYENNLGLCLRFPPTDANGRFPHVYASQRCAEWKEKT